MAYEAIINGDPLDTIDPVHSITVIIDNGASEYRYSAEELQSLQIVEIADRAETR